MVERVSDHELAFYVRMPYMVGVYLAVNSVPDLYAVVDGPDCLFFKAEFVHGTHDMHATLLNAEGRHRVINTVADTHKVVLDREDAILSLLREVCANPEVGAVIVTALPMAAITGSQYDRLARLVSEESGKPVFDVPAKSLQADWLEGYAEVLAALATGLSLQHGQVEGGVAVVGLLLDRGEADHLANIRVLRRLMEQGLGLRVISVWPSNSRVSTLSNAGKAKYVVSLPYGRKAARTLARRTGATLIETVLPFGIEGTAQFLRDIANATGLEQRAETFIREESEACLKLLQKASERVLRGMQFGFIGDPYLAPRVKSLLETLGAKIVGFLPTQYPPSQCADLPDAKAFESGEMDFCITTTQGIEVVAQRHIPYFEFGFPSYGRHMFAGAPFLGFEGALWFVEALVNHVLFFRGLQRQGLFLPNPFAKTRPSLQPPTG